MAQMKSSTARIMKYSTSAFAFMEVVLWRGGARGNEMSGYCIVEPVNVCGPLWGWA